MVAKRTILWAILALSQACQSASEQSFVGVGRRGAGDSLRSDQPIEQWIEVLIQPLDDSDPKQRQRLREVAEAIEARLLGSGQAFGGRHLWEPLRLRVLQYAAEFPDNRKGNARRIREALDALSKNRTARTNTHG